MVPSTEVPEFFISAIEQAGFRTEEGRRWVLPRSDGQAVHFVPQFGSNRRVLHMSWWVALDAAEPRQGAYRSPSDPAPAAPVQIVMRPRNGMDRLGLRLGLNRALYLGDPVFDAQVYIESDGDEGTVRQVVAAPELRAATLSLLREDQAARVVVDGVHGRLRVTRTWNLTQLQASDVRRLVNRLCRMRTDMPRLAFVHAAPLEGPNAFQKSGLILILVAVLGFLALGSVSAEVLMKVARTPASIAVVAFGALALMVIVRRLVSRSTAGFRYFLLMGIPGLAAWILWAWATLSWLR